MNTKTLQSNREIAVQRLLNGEDPGSSFPDLRIKFNQIQAKKKKGKSLYYHLKKALGLKHRH